MRRSSVAVAPIAIVCALLAGQAFAGALAVETYTLPNGLNVILHPDHTLPQVTVNVWYNVGSRDERAGRTGFAHLFEHLMFMGTTRVPGNQFDMLMESQGGSNNASTSEDRTDYFSVGPSSILPTLLWLDADRLEGLGKAMTKEKLDLQRSVVRNERRQSYENRPYGAANLEIPAAMYPETHPYHHPVIGSHADLEAATLEDVKSFFDTYYVPGNASLVVAGDFDPAATRALVAKLFGALPTRPLPPAPLAPAVTLDTEIRRLVTDKVQFPRIWLVWHSPAAYAAGDAEMDIAAALLADGESGRLYARLVQEEQIARDVAVYQSSQELGSLFEIRVTAAEGVDLERIKRSTLEVLDALLTSGPSAAELARVKAMIESRFLRGKEGLVRRATQINEYRHFFGVADGFDRDLARRLAPSAACVGEWARQVWGPGRLDLRVLPLGAKVEGASLETRPADLATKPAKLAVPETLMLANGATLHVLPRPGSGLFSGYLLADGGERVIPAAQAGLGSLAATMLTKGAGARDAAAFADAVATLGAQIDADSNWHHFTVRVSGLASKLDPTLDLFADALLRPRLAAADFEREKALALAEIRARADEPNAVAWLVARTEMFGRDDPRGRPVAGWLDTVAKLRREDVVEALLRLLPPAGTTLVFAGDLDPAALKRALDAKLASWKRASAAPPMPPAPVKLERPGLVLVHRPGAPQTVLLMARPIAPVGDVEHAERLALDTLFGGTFTSRLMQNIREKHGYSYGARSSITEDGNLVLVGARSSVQTAVTAAALGEFKKEFDRLASGDVSADELAKAVRLAGFDIVTGSETVGEQASVLASLVTSTRPLDTPSRELAALGQLEVAATNREAKSGLYDWGSLLVVLVGDRDVVLPQLAAAGFPAPRLLDTEGRPLANEPAVAK